MNYEKLFEQIKKKKRFLCVGLDSDISKIPGHLLELKDPLLEFNTQIIDATAPYTVAYKLNTAFYEVLGWEGWMQLESTVKYIKHNYPDIFVIVDAKRGDIGNTSKMYAKAFFENIGADAVTVAPYMGKDSVEPFLEWGDDTWTIILDHTSNDSSEDLQTLHIEENGDRIFEHILKKAINEWGASPDKTMFVVGATHPESFGFVRNIIPDHFLLVPGIGAQGGNLEEVCTYALNDSCGILVNSSRGIIFVDNSKNFARSAQNEAKKLQKKMETILENKWKPF